MNRGGLTWVPAYHPHAGVSDQLHVKTRDNIGKGSQPAERWAAAVGAGSAGAPAEGAIVLYVGQQAALEPVAGHHAVVRVIPRKAHLLAIPRGLSYEGAAELLAVGGPTRQEKSNSLVRRGDEVQMKIPRYRNPPRASPVMQSYKVSSPHAPCLLQPPQHRWPWGAGWLLTSG